MPRYTSQQQVKSGVPLGGIGAGKLEIMPNGTLDNFTFLNNSHKPYSHSTPDEIIGVLGFHFGIYCNDGKKKIAKLLQTARVSHYPTVESIDYRGEFPFAFLNYQDAEIPLNVSLEAYSSFIPGEEKNSCLPAAVFEFTVSNPSSRSADASLLIHVKNSIGEWCVGRFNQVIDEKDLVNLTMCLRKPLAFDQTQGTMSAAVIKSDRYSISYCGETNLFSQPFYFNRDTIQLDAFEAFAQNGELPNSNSEIPVNSESVELGGALAVKCRLKPKSRVTIPVIVAWNIPVCPEGHVYSNYFRTSRDVVHFVAHHRKELYQKTKHFYDQTKKLPVPEWLKDALLNNLYTFYSSTLWTRKMQFGFLESPQVCPLMGTLDVRFYSSVALALLFPKLETTELLQFAEVQRADGYIMHDLGRMRFDLPSVSTNRLFWKDLNSKFILMCYRDYLWSQDQAFLHKMYPFIKKAYFWLVSTDKNKDFLPDNEGADHTFDIWNCYGTSAYTASLFLAATLALEKMTDLVSDKATKKIAGEYFEKGKKSFEKKLWNKTYFLEYNNKNNRNNMGAPKASASCTVSQLAGQWYAHLLGLGYIVSKDKVKKAIETILKLNAESSEYGMTNAVTSTGERDRNCLHSENIWIGVNYSFLSLAIYEGFTKEALAVGEKQWAHITNKEQNPWNQPDLYSSADGKYLFGDHYMRNLVVWSLVCALATKDKSIENYVNTFRLLHGHGESGRS